MIRRNLFLFTNHFPFSTQENFLEDEIGYLCSSFKTVYIIPKDGGGIKRNVPSNCSVLQPLSLSHGSRLRYVVKGLFSFKTFVICLKDFVGGKVFFNKNRFRSWMSSVLQLNNLCRNKELQLAFSFIQDDDLLYSYWGTDLIKIALLYKGGAKIVARFHGAWDLWEESYGGYFPFRKEVVKRLSQAYFVSRKGEDYFRQRYPDCLTFYAPLGSNDFGVGPIDSCDALEVVSCSTIYPLKRVDLIFRVLDSMKGTKIHWTHLGGGKQFDYLKSLVRNPKNTHLTVSLKGQMTHSEVMAYYKMHHFDLFINLSANEGVPVSIMEASSFGIPVVATNVGATSEVVSDEVGILVSCNPSIEEVTSAIDKIQSACFNPRKYWTEHYYAENNYSSFVASLIQVLQ